MTNKRKSMNAGNDAHAYKLRIYAVYHRSAAIAKQCSKGFRDACPEWIRLWVSINPACSIRSHVYGIPENVMKTHEKRR